MESNLKGTWKTPEQVMRFHRLKKKLNKRMTEKSAAPLPFSSNSNSEDSLMEFPVIKRKNPFSTMERKVKRAEETDESGVEADLSSQSGEKSLFNLLSRTHLQSPRTPTSFTNIISHLSQHQDCKYNQSVSAIARPLPKDDVNSDLQKKIPIDWSLKSKLRFMSTKPFAWSAAVRTTEEVSAVTGFARCVEPGRNPDGAIDLDTSPNAQFHRCCLFWQHPHLPWIPLFTRTTAKLSPTLVAAQLQIAETLHDEFVKAFKSLFQLIRTQQCPYFYIIGTQFHCLFRAAGLAGQAEPNALISPTTRGFRKMLEDQDIKFTMPLRKRKRRDSLVSIGEGEISLSQSSQCTNGNESNDDDSDVEDWMDSEQVRKLTIAQKAKDRVLESKMDSCGDSLVMVTGMDLQGLFNLLVNCKNNMDRLPPTLVAPNAFQLATLRSCKVRDAVVMVDGVKLYSVQVEGPIMPHALSQMCLLLDESQTEYSAAIATVKETRPFTSVISTQDEVPKTAPSMFFLKEYLSDCGLSPRVMSRLCESDPNRFEVFDSIEPHQCI